MKNYIRFGTFALLFLLIGCSSKSKEENEYIYQPKTQVNSNLSKILAGTEMPVNTDDFIAQVQAIKDYSPSLYNSHKATYLQIINWIEENKRSSKKKSLQIRYNQIYGDYSGGKFHFTGYFTPIIDAKRYRTSEYRYPLYAKPNQKGRLPSRANIQNGALANRGLEIAYTKSHVDNFFMGVQGSGYVRFVDEGSVYFFAYSGKNGHAYSSIGRIMVEEGLLSKEGMSAKAIKDWAARNPEYEVNRILNKNRSFVFFQPKKNAPVRGAAGVPLIPLAAVASDKRQVPLGTVLLVEVPVLNAKGNFSGRNEYRLMIALDVGGAIKGNRLDLYQGVGKNAEHFASHMNHYGRVWRVGGKNIF